MTMIDNGQAAKASKAEAQRQILAEWLDRRVVVQGHLQKLATAGSKKPRQVALFEDCEVTLPNKERHDLGHVWLQNAEPLRDVTVGDRVRCSCRVSVYKRYVDGVETRSYNLCYPNEIQVVKPVALTTPEPKPVEPPKPPAPPAPAAVNPLQVLLRIKGVVEGCGGMEAVQGLLAAVEGVGGWDKAVEVKGLAAELGGTEALRTVLGMLRV
jgi:hypothetical protein